MAQGFHGWRIVAIAAIAQPLGAGLIGTYQVLVTPLSEEFSISATRMGLGMTLFLLVTALTSPMIGPAVDRGPLRAIMTSGVGLAVGGVLLLAQAAAAWQLLAGLAVFAVGVALYGSVPLHMLLVNWFEARRGRAIAIAAMGLSIGSATIPLAMTWATDTLGWRSALRILAGLVLVVLVPLFTLVVRRPEDVGQHPDGAPTPPDTSFLSAGAATTTAELLRDRNFWLIALGFALVFATVTAGSVFLYPHLESIGLTRPQAALAPTLMAAAAFTTKPIAGVVIDRIGPRPVAALTLVVYSGSWLLVATQTELVPLMLAAVVAGLGSGSVAILLPVFVGACFDRRSIGRATGLRSTVGMPFLLAGAPLLGAVAETTGSFRPGFFAMAGVVLLAAMLLGCVAIPSRRGGEPAS